VGDARSAAAAVEGVCVLGYSGGSGLGGVRVGMGCFQSTARRPRPGYEDPVGLASETAFSVSEVEALFELFKSISGSVIDDGLINKVNI
jgi:hypothetical protein